VHTGPVLAEDPACFAALNSCYRANATAPPNSQVVVYNIYDAASNTFLRTDIACNVGPGQPGNTLPSITTITAEATKRAPHPHTTTDGTHYLLNTAIVFYAQPPTPTTNLTNPTIAAFTLAGHTFTIHLHLHHTTWTWNDHTPDTTTTDNPLGHPYTHTDPCEDNTHCSHYISHTYTHPGTYTPTSHTHYTATYTLDNNPQQQPIPGYITTTDPTGRTITIQQAHAILIPTTP
jgi:hypothetical protein